jgi:hypothetical protein
MSAGLLQRTTILHIFLSLELNSNTKQSREELRVNLNGVPGWEVLFSENNKFINIKNYLCKDNLCCNVVQVYFQI